METLAEIQACLNKFKKNNEENPEKLSHEISNWVNERRLMRLNLKHQEAVKQTGTIFA